MLDPADIDDPITVRQVYNTVTSSSSLCCCWLLLFLILSGFCLISGVQQMR